MANKKLSAEQINIVLSDLKEQGHEVIMTALKVANRSSALKTESLMQRGTIQKDVNVLQVKIYLESQAGINLFTH